MRRLNQVSSSKTFLYSVVYSKTTIIGVYLGHCHISITKLFVKTDLIFFLNSLYMFDKVLNMLFCRQGFLPQTLTIHEIAGKGKGPSIFLFTTSIRPEHSKIYTQLCSWDDYHAQIIEPLVTTRLVLDEIYQPLELSFDWCRNFNIYFCLHDDFILDSVTAMPTIFT